MADREYTNAKEPNYGALRGTLQGLAGQSSSRAPEIQSVIVKLEGNISSLEKDLEVLADRLEPALHIAPPENVSTASPSEAYSAPLARNLQECIYRLQALSRRITSLHQRIEL